MSYHLRRFIVPVMSMALVVPIAAAQKPSPAPLPSPTPSPNPGRPSNTSSPGVGPTQPEQDLIMFLRGSIRTHDGTPVPSNVLVERICNNRVRQQVYASPHGDFSMQLGSRTDSFPEASAEASGSLGSSRRDTSMGIPRRELTNCEMRASVSGFHSGTISLMELDSSAGNVDVGNIVMQRSTKVDGATVSAIPYKAPKNARKAYDKGMQAEKGGKLEDAQKYFATAVEIYPSGANTWFQLGNVLQKQGKKDEAREAFTKATSVDAKFLPPYMSLASIAYETGNWRDVLDFTGHILDLDPMNNAAANNYILDLDPLNYVDAYFYNAMANFRLNKMDEAEKIGVKAEHLDLRTRFPQLHLLLAEIFTRKSDYGRAISEIQNYLDLVPNAKNIEGVHEQLAKLEKLNGTAPAQ